jgi:hypothetical protein
LTKYYSSCLINKEQIVQEQQGSRGMQSSIIEQKNNPQSNAIEQITVGYGCKCGFKTSDKKEFTTHVLRSSLQEGKGTHKSIGRINMDTGEVISPPWAGRTKEEQKNTKSKQESSKRAGANAGGDGKFQHSTGLPTEAQQIRVVPKTFTMDYTPIMRAAQDAATKFFNWRQDMPLENFLDTCLYLFFLEKGVTLCGYIVDKSLLEKEEKSDDS